MGYNKYNSSLEELNFDSLPDEVKDQYIDIVNSVPLIKRHLAPMPRACDLPKDKNGRIIVDVTHPHVLENMDYFRQAALHFKKHGCYTFLKPNPNPNSEFGKWFTEEIHRCLYGMVRESDGEWITGDHYFLLNYMPMLVNQVDEDSGETMRIVGFADVWEAHYYKFHYLNQARVAGKHATELASRSKGKAHPYSQVVYTPDGKKMWGELQIGDYVFGDNGIPTRIVDIPFDEETDIYKVTLSDGRELRCSLGHLFKVRDVRKKEQIKVLSLEDIINSDYHHFRKNGKYEDYYSIQVQGCSEFNNRHVEVDPYTLGLLLGDGYFRYKDYENVVAFTSRKEDMDTYIKYCPYRIYKIDSGSMNYRIKIDGFGTYLKSVGMYMVDTTGKYIPDEYKYNSKEVRLNVLRGLMDTDGTVNNNGVPMITTVSERLRDDIIWICRSLGYNTRCFTKQGQYNGIKTKLNYNITILSGSEVFNLERKKKLVTTYKSTYSKCRKDWTHISNIELIGTERAKCITVDNESHCYLIGDFIVTHNSYSAAAMLAKRFILGESKQVSKKVASYILAFDKAKLTGGDQVLNKFLFCIDHCAQHTQFPYKRLINTLQNMEWKMGYKDLDSGAECGSLNSVLGKSLEDEGKLRGSRGVLYLFEEAGNFNNLLSSWNNLRPSVEEGKKVFGQLVAYGTAGDKNSDFASMQELMYHPDGYNIYKIENVFDKEGLGRKWFSLFTPSYLNYAECYDENGNSDVSKALITILKDRYLTKYNSSDPNTVIRNIAEWAITPQEAILRTSHNMFPVSEINQRIAEIDADPSFFDGVYVGTLVQSGNGEVVFNPTDDAPIRDFPTKTNKIRGAIEIFEMPVYIRGKVPYGRYIVSLDNYENDIADSMSLGSCFVLDTITDQIVCEYTGRPDYADDLNEIVRKICLFYNAKCMVENNKKSTYAYFKRMNSLHLLADTPDWLRQKDLVKTANYGNSSKGVTATKIVIQTGLDLMRDWLLKPVNIIQKGDDGAEHETAVPNLHFIKNRALLREMSLYNPDLNVDRIMSCVQLMLYREEVLSTARAVVGDGRTPADDVVNDPFFTKNDSMFSHDLNTW